MNLENLKIQAREQLRKLKEQSMAEGAARSFAVVAGGSILGRIFGGRLRNEAIRMVVRRTRGGAFVVNGCRYRTLRLACEAWERARARGKDPHGGASLLMVAANVIPTLFPLALSMSAQTGAKL